MDTNEELLPFLREMLQQRPSRRTLKIYAIGSTLAVLGAIAGLIQSVFAFDEHEDLAKTSAEEEAAAAAGALTAPRTEATFRGSSPDETKDGTKTTTTLRDENRRVCANRLHAS